MEICLEENCSKEMDQCMKVYGVLWLAYGSEKPEDRNNGEGYFLQECQQIFKFFTKGHIVLHCIVTCFPILHFEVIGSELWHAYEFYLAEAGH